MSDPITDDGYYCEALHRVPILGCKDCVDVLQKRIAVLETQNTRMNKDGWLGYKATLVKDKRIKELEAALDQVRAVLQAAKP